MKTPVIFFLLLCLSHFGHSQKSSIDSIQELIKETILVGATDIDNIQSEIALRQELMQILKDSIENDQDSMQVIVADTLVSTEHIDSMIAKAHLKTIIASNKEKANLDLIHYLNARSLYKNDQSRPKRSKKADWISLLTEQEFELEDLHERLGSAEVILTADKKASKKKEDRSKNEEVFNTSSIVAQVITASIESGSPFKAKAEIDNKLFEDRKAFMSWPLNKARVEKRYSNSSKYIRFSSSDKSVKNISQGLVIYSKKLADGAYTVIVQHDNGYYSVYRNLRSSNPGYGQYLGYGQEIGTARVDSEGRAVLDFEIWKGKQAINPSHWLKNG